MSQYNSRVDEIVSNAISGIDKEAAQGVVERAIEGIYELQAEMDAELGNGKRGDVGGRKHLFPKPPPKLDRIRGNRIISIETFERQKRELESGEKTYEQIMAEDVW